MRIERLSSLVKSSGIAQLRLTRGEQEREPLVGIEVGLWDASRQVQDIGGNLHDRIPC